MAKLILLYENFADQALFSGGSWASALPLTNLADPQVTKVARSSGVLPDATKFNVDLPAVKTFRAMAFGPTNVTSGAKFRITGFADAERETATIGTGWINVGLDPVDSLTLEWEDDNFWDGVEPIDDPDGAGTWLIHVFDTPATAQFWTVEIDDGGNPDGYVQIGRAFMGRAYEPTHNFSPSGNSFGFVSNTTSQKSLGGQRYFNRRRLARRFRFAFPYLPESEMWAEVYRIQVISNQSEQVFVIPDPDDLTHRNKQAFLGRLSEISSWELLNVGLAGTAFDIEESL